MPTASYKQGDQEAEFNFQFGAICVARCTGICGKPADVRSYKRDRVEGMILNVGGVPVWNQVVGLHPLSQQAVKRVEFFLLEEKEAEHRRLRSFANSQDY